MNLNGAARLAEIAKLEASFEAISDSVQTAFDKNVAQLQLRYDTLVQEKTTKKLAIYDFAPSVLSNLLLPNRARMKKSSDSRRR